MSDRRKYDYRRDYRLTMWNRTFIAGGGSILVAGYEVPVEVALTSGRFNSADKRKHKRACRQLVKAIKSGAFKPAALSRTKEQTK